MLRSLYSCLLRLHPSGFRKRFADEMLSIFDQAAGKSAAAKLLLDGFVSLVRQWTLRPEFWDEVSSGLASAQPPGPDGIPSFSTLDPFRPRPGAVIHGLVLSTAIFFLTCFAIRYSWIHVLHVRIPHVEFEALKPVPIDEAILQSYVGVYDVTSGKQLTLTIRLVNGTLMMEIPGEPRRLLLPVSVTTFVVTGPGNCWIEFIPERDGNTRRLRLIQDGKSFRAQR